LVPVFWAYAEVASGVGMGHPDIRPIPLRTAARVRKKERREKKNKGEEISRRTRR
jgi:hypothetical protein